MVTIEPTTDISYIKSVFSNPAIYQDMKDDSCPQDAAWVSDVDMRSKPGVFLKVAVDGTPSGLFWGIWKEQALEIHTALLETCRGKNAIRAARQLIDWVFRNTDAERIISYAWSDQPHVSWYCRAVGLQKLNTENWPATRNGHPVTITHYSLQRGQI